MTPWQIIEIVAEESDERTRQMTVADKARVRWEDAD
jgi:hypothetical protein